MLLQYSTHLAGSASLSTPPPSLAIAQEVRVTQFHIAPLDFLHSGLFVLNLIPDCTLREKQGQDPLHTAIWRLKQQQQLAKNSIFISLTDEIYKRREVQTQS